MSSPSPSKNILITGAARGIGRVLSRTLLASPSNHKIYLLDINEVELTHTATVHLGNHHQSGRLDYAVVDLTDPTAVRSTIKKAAIEFFDGRIDVLINNAGIPKPSWSDGRTMEDESTLSDWNRYISANLTAPFLVSQAVIPYMKSPPQESHIPMTAGPGGCIIHISSYRAHFSSPNSEAYSTTKAGLLGLTHSMAVSGKKWNIRVNAILPGRISVLHECKETDEKGEDSQKPASWEEQNPEEEQRGHLVNRTGMGEDIAGTVEWLMGAGFVTGQEVVVDGGVSVKLG